MLMAALLGLAQAEFAVAAYPSLIVTQSDYATLQALASQSPWSDMKAGAISYANGTYNPAASLESRLDALNWIVANLKTVWVIAFVILFQPELRRALAALGQNPLFRNFVRSTETGPIAEIVQAAYRLANEGRGALIVIERDMGLRTFYETGIALDALVSYDLLMNIFTRRSPLHDGAVIIAEGRIKAASCYLPLTTSPSLSRSYGTRHRAAIGISEESDAVAIVVSEERGVVSLAHEGKIVESLDAKGLEAELEQILSHRTEPQPQRQAGIAVAGSSCRTPRTAARRTLSIGSSSPTINAVTLSSPPTEARDSAALCLTIPSNKDSLNSNNYYKGE